VDQALLFLDDNADSITFNIVAIDLLESRRQMGLEYMKKISDKRLLINEGTTSTGLVQVAFRAPDKVSGAFHITILLIDY
jgi:hypothetical protein